MLRVQAKRVRIDARMTSILLRIILLNRQTGRVAWMPTDFVESNTQRISCFWWWRIDKHLNLRLRLLTIDKQNGKKCTSNHENDFYLQSTSNQITLYTRGTIYKPIEFSDGFFSFVEKKEQAKRNMQMIRNPANHKGTLNKNRMIQRKIPAHNLIAIH